MVNVSDPSSDQEIRTFQQIISLSVNACASALSLPQFIQSHKHKRPAWSQPTRSSSSHSEQEMFSLPFHKNSHHFRKTNSVWLMMSVHIADSYLIWGLFRHSCVWFHKETESCDSELKLHNIWKQRHKGLNAPFVQHNFGSWPACVWVLGQLGYGEAACGCVCVMCVGWGQPIWTDFVGLWFRRLWTTHKHTFWACSLKKGVCDKTESLQFPITNTPNKS